MIKSLNNDINLGMAKQEKTENAPYFLVKLALRDNAEQANADAQYSLGLSFLTRHGSKELNPQRLFIVCSRPQKVFVQWHNAMWPICIAQAMEHTKTSFKLDIGL